MKSKYQCPLCKGELVILQGHATGPTDGITIKCPNLQCGMADWGWGKNEDRAFDIFKAKCGVK